METLLNIPQDQILNLAGIAGLFSLFLRYGFMVFDYAARLFAFFKLAPVAKLMTRIAVGLNKFELADRRFKVVVIAGFILGLVGYVYFAYGLDTLQLLAVAFVAYWYKKMIHELTKNFKPADLEATLAAVNGDTSGQAESMGG